MTPAIYHVQFTSSLQARGEGLAVFKDGSINGGDEGYLYVGTFAGDSSNVTATLKIKKWNPVATSVFGPLKEFDLNLRGTFQPDGTHFKVTGVSPQIPGASITITGDRISAAA